MTELLVGNVFTKVISDDNKALMAIWDLLSYQVTNHQIIARRAGFRNWDGKKSFYDRRASRFLAGFTKRVIEMLTRFDRKFTVTDMRQSPRTPLAFGDCSLDGISYYPHQNRAISDFTSAPFNRGIAKLATGAGKTEMAIGLTKGYELPTLFLTHRVNLLHQTMMRFKKRLPGWEKRIGIIGDGIFEPNFVTVATVQTLHPLIKNDPKKAMELLGQYQFLIIDEAHRSGSSQFMETACMCRNAYVRLGLTATPFMKGNAADDLALMGIVGDIESEVGAQELIEAGILARPFFKFFTIEDPDGKIKQLKNWRDIYEKGIVSNKSRNTIIALQATKLVAMGRKPLIIVQEVSHGNILLEAMKAARLKPTFIKGSDSYEERETALRGLVGGKFGVVIATNIFDEGVDCNEIDAVILAAGTKSAPALLQRTGRALRKKEDGNYAIIIDFIDTQNKKLFEHSIRRYNLVKSEPGFQIL